MLISPTDPQLHYVARLDWRDARGPLFDWAGSSVTIRFEGAAISARLRTSNADRLQVVVDGVAQQTLVLTQEPRLHELARDLPPGEHNVALFKRTESLHGAVQFFGFELSPGAKPLPARPAERFIEFIGDSITAGYGNEAADERAHFSPETSNNYLAWDAVAARALQADYLAVAVSASRLTEPPDELGMPTFYRQTLFLDRASRWDFAKARRPDVVVINLGTNDFGRDDPSELRWKDSYEKLLAFIRANYAEAQLFLVTGTMMTPGAKLDRLQKWNAEIVAARRLAGDGRIHALNLGTQNPRDGFGADGHPSVRTHARMAEQLVAAIRAATGW